MVVRAQWRGEAVYLVKPPTFMNVSGPAVAGVAAQRWGPGRPI